VKIPDVDLTLAGEENTHRLNRHNSRLLFLSSSYPWT